MGDRLIPPVDLWSFGLYRIPTSPFICIYLFISISAGVMNDDLYEYAQFYATGGGILIHI